MIRFLGICALLAATPTTPAAEAPQRIVSIGGAVTEIVYALGMDRHLVAVDTTSLYPAAAQRLPNVGYMRQLAAEPIVALAPDLVLAVADSGPASVLRQLRAAGLRVVMIPDTPSPAGVLAKIRAVANALGRTEAGERLAADLRSQFESIAAWTSHLHRRPKVLFLLSIGSGAPLAAGRGTSAAGIIALAAGENAVHGFTGYKPLNPEAVVALAPEVVLVGKRTLKALGGRQALLRRPAIAATPAGRNDRVVVMDALLLLGFGPRTPTAIRRLAAALHPRTPTLAVRQP